MNNRQRRYVAAVAALLFLILLFFHAGSAWEAVAYRLLLEGGLVVVWCLSAAGAGWLALRLLRIAASPIFMFATAAGLGLGIYSLLVLGLGLAGWFNQIAAILLLLCGGIAGVISFFHHKKSARGTFDVPLVASNGWNWLWLIAVPPLAIAVLGATVPPGILWGDEPHGYDVLEYHLQLPREWYEAGRILPLRHNVFSYFPLNVEMQYLLAMQLRGGPWTGMYLAQFMHMGFFALTVMAIYGLALSLNASRRAAILAAVAAAAVPWMPLLAAVAYNEGGVLFWGTLAIGWAMRGSLETRDRYRSMALAGVMAGLACGAKLTAVPTVLLALAAVTSRGVILSYRQSRNFQSIRPALRGVGLMLLMGLIAFSPWLIRNWRWVGNPVFPQAMEQLGKGHFSDVQVERWQRSTMPAEGEQSLPARLKVGWMRILADWRFGYLLLPLAMIGIILGRKQTEVMFLAALLLFLIIFWMSATHLQSRFFVLAIPISALIVARTLDRWTPMIATAVAIAAMIGWLNIRSTYFHGGGEPRRITTVIEADAIGISKLDYLLPLDLSGIPQTARIRLVGDSRAFMYSLPMSRLNYRTVFDIDAGSNHSAIEAWLGDSLSTIPPEDVVIIDPIEMERFRRHYWMVPAMDADLPGPRDRTFILQRQHVGTLHRLAEIGRYFPQ